MSCVVPGCNTLDSASKNKLTIVSYHRPPKSMITKWAEALFPGRSIWWSHYEVCSLHFRKEDIKIINEKPMLRPNAVPVLHLNLKSPIGKLMKTIALEQLREVKGPLDKSTEAKKTKKLPQDLPTGENSFSFRVKPWKIRLGHVLYSQYTLEATALRYTNNFRTMLKDIKRKGKIKYMDAKRIYPGCSSDKLLAIHRDIFYMRMQFANKTENNPNLTEEDLKSEPRWLGIMVLQLQSYRQGKDHDERQEAVEELFACKPWMDYLKKLRKKYPTLRGEALYAALSASCDVPAQYLGPYWESQVRKWRNSVRWQLCASDVCGVPDADVAVYCGDITLFTDQILRVKRTQDSLIELIDLISSIRDRNLPSALLWAALLEAINSIGHQVSGVVLQRRWYELVLKARRLALRPTPKHAIIPPTHILMLERFPEIVISPIKSWNWLIENNRIYTDEQLKSIPKHLFKDILEDLIPKELKKNSEKNQEENRNSPETNSADPLLPNDLDFNKVKREVTFSDDSDDDVYKNKEISESNVEFGESNLEIGESSLEIGESNDEIGEGKNETEGDIDVINWNIVGILGISENCEDVIEKYVKTEPSDDDENEDSLVTDEKTIIDEIKIEEHNLVEYLHQNKDELPQKTTDVEIDNITVLNRLKGSLTSNLNENNTISKENNKIANEADEAKSNDSNNTSKDSVVIKVINENSIVKEKEDETITLGGRLAKIVHLQDIESVRRNNKGILTAQVAPIKKVPETPTDTEDAIRSPPEIDPENKNANDPEDECKSDIDTETTITPDVLKGIIKNLKELDAPKKLSCCFAQQHIFLSTGRYLTALEQGSTYQWNPHTHVNCTCCCKDIVKAIPRQLMKKHLKKRIPHEPNLELHSPEPPDRLVILNKPNDLANKQLNANPSSTNYITEDKIKNPTRIDPRSSTEDNGSVTLTITSNIPIVSVKVVKSSHNQPLLSLEPVNTQDEDTLTKLFDYSEDVDVNDDNVRDTTPSAHVKETSINFDNDTSNDTTYSGPEHDAPLNVLNLEEILHTMPRLKNNVQKAINVEWVKKDPAASHSKIITIKFPKIAVQYLRSNINTNYINNLPIKTKSKPTSGPYTSSKDFFADHNHLPNNIFILKVERDSIPIRLTDRIILVTTDFVTCDHPQLYSVENGRRLAFLTSKQMNTAKHALTINFSHNSQFMRKSHIISAISTLELARSKILKRTALLYDSLNFDLLPLFPYGISKSFSLMTVSRYAHLMPSLERRFSEINDLLSSWDNDEDDNDVVTTVKTLTKERSEINIKEVTLSNTTTENDSEAGDSNIDIDISKQEIEFEISNTESDSLENVMMGAKVSGEKRHHADTYCDISKRLKIEKY